MVASSHTSMSTSQLTLCRTSSILSTSSSARIFFASSADTPTTMSTRTGQLIGSASGAVPLGS